MLDDQTLDLYARTLASTVDLVSVSSPLSRAEVLALLRELSLSTDQAAAVISYALAREILTLQGDTFRVGPAAPLR